MKPLNSSERATGLLKFAGVFLFTIILVLFAVYFDFQAVPQKQLSNYKDENAKLDTLVKTDTKLIGQLADLNSSFVQFQNNPGNTIAANAVANGITSLADLSKKDSTSYTGKLCGQIVTGYGIAAATINRLKDSGSNADDAKKLKDDLKACQDDLKDKNNQILTLQNTLALYQNKK
jgi:hypothetical protein